MIGMSTLSQYLLEYREKKHLTQAEMAEILGISQPAYSSHEAGRRLPRVGTLVKIADRLGVDIRRLLPQSTTRRKRGA